ncbi:hypothetical protein ACOBQX_05605 [Actinokineospora sp. G85]|uniref:hypothetical protein n=1 Tax=Actinokineospora sp. G85 TaxID=3406626 RepID=UPI003C786525
MPLDTLRLDVAVVPSPIDASAHAVRVFIDEVEQTERGAGMGMDPYDVFVPVNRLVAGPEPRTVPIARCSCGTYGCSRTDVTITRLGDRVRWDWSHQAPMRRAAEFDAVEYDREVARLGADTSWEDAGRRAGRLVLAGADWEALARHELTPGFVGGDHRDPGVFVVALRYRESEYQVFLREPWGSGTPDDLAARLVARLATPPREWEATWHPVVYKITHPPAIAGVGWQREIVF